MQKLLSILIITSLILSFAACGNEKDSTTIEEISNGQQKTLTTIWKFVQPEIAQELRQPDTAEFDDFSKIRFFEISKDTYEVMGTVKGENAFGNMVSNYYVATVIINSKGQPTIVNDIEFLAELSYNERIILNEQLQNRIDNGQQYLSSEELATKTIEHPIYVKSTKYLDASFFDYSSSGMLQAQIYNNSDVPIKNVEVGFVAWDKNALPIKIEQYISISDGSYFSKITYDSINLMPNETYTGKIGDTYYGMKVDGDLQISFLNAVVISYEDFDGEIWDNPLLLDFKNLYEEKRLIN